jgi:hypothetical protein
MESKTFGKTTKQNPVKPTAPNQQPASQHKISALEFDEAKETLDSKHVQTMTKYSTF